MGQSESGITPAIKICIASEIVVNQLIGIFGPYELRERQYYCLFQQPRLRPIHLCRRNALASGEDQGDRGKPV
jgi:hypothetical protein